MMATLLELLVAATPVLVVGGVLWFAQRVRGRREVRVARQIALTDAIHREVGPAAAPVVERNWRGAWTVRMAVPLEREHLVGALTRITQDLFFRLDHTGRPRLEILLTRRS